MRKTIFAGLTVLDPDESLFTDNGSFQGRDRDEIDRALQIGVKLHRHTGLPGLTDPNVAPSATVIPSGGTIDAGETISVGYTLEDGQGGETLLSPLSVTTTPSPMDIPIYAPSAVADYTGGELLVDTYFYAQTWIDSNGGETPLGPVATVERAPGYASGRIQLSQLGHGMASVGAVGWRLFRAKGGGEFELLTNGSVEDDTFTDDGTAAVNCDIHPPTDNENTTAQINTLKVQLPLGGVITPATFINLYASVTGDFAQSSLLAQYPVSSAGNAVYFPALSFLDSQPPDVNRSYGGANQIDPDTELLDWHWKRPVANAGALPSGAQGDVRLNTATGNFHLMLRNPSGSSSQWTTFAGGGGSGIVVDDEGVEIANPVTEIDFVGAGVQATGNGSGAVQVLVPGQEGRYGSGTVRAVEEAGGLHLVLDKSSMQFVASGAASVGVEDIGGGSARITIGAVDTVGVGGGGGNPTDFRDAEGTSIPDAARIEFTGSGGVGVDLIDQGGGSGRVVIGAPPPGMAASALLDVTDADGTRVEDIGQLDFRASGGVGVDVTSLGGGSARVMIGAPPTVAPVSGMAASALLDVTDADGPNVPDIGQLKFVASGGASVGVSDLGGGSAQVTMAAPSANIVAVENWHNVGDPGEVPFASAWANGGSGFSVAAFRKEGDLVRMRGTVAKTAANGTAVEGETIFTLPAGYRPPARVTGQGMGGRVDVNTDGTVIFVGGEAYQSLDGITFSTLAAGGGEIIGSFAPLARRWASATINLASGASGVVDFTGSAAGERLLKISTNRRARVRMYGDSAARVADHTRAPATDPTGDHGVLLDYMNTATASGAISRVAPHVDAHNLDDPAANKQYLSVMNYDLAGNVVVAFLYIPTEVV